MADVGSRFNGIVLSDEEYVRVENTYIAAVVRFSVATSASLFRVVFMGSQDANFALSAGQLVVRSDVGPIVRGNLRGELDCALEAVNGRLQIAFGYDLYMYVGADIPCERAVAGAEEDGLWLEPGVPLRSWEDDDA
ncbi:MAG: hypothetical protein PGN15_09055 [Aeromicrobium erythreum]